MTASPEQVERPTSVSEIQRLVTESPRHWRIRMAGSGHSFTPIVPSNHLFVLPHVFHLEIGIDSQRLVV
ncbi:MAG: hypothetical protein ACO3EM_07930, partial [Ilumatobacteraceae bacterium]